MIPRHFGGSQQSSLEVGSAEAPIDHLQGRIESVFGRRFGIFGWIVFWFAAAGAVRDSSEVFFDPKDGVAAHLLMMAICAAVVWAGPYLWYRYAKVVEVRGRTLLVRTTPRSDARVYQRSDVAEVFEGSGRQAGVLQIRFRDGRRVLVDRWFTEVAVLRLWLEHAVEPGSVPIGGSGALSRRTDGRVESLFGRRLGIITSILGWALTAAILVHGSEFFLGVRRDLVAGLGALSGVVMAATLPPYVWYQYARVIEVRGASVLVRTTPWSAARTYRRSDVVEVREGSGRRARVLYVRFRDGKSVRVDGWFTDVMLLRRWLDRAV